MSREHLGGEHRRDEDGRLGERLGYGRRLTRPASARHHLRLQEVGCLVVVDRRGAEPAPLPEGHACSENPRTDRKCGTPPPPPDGGNLGDWQSSDHQHDQDEQQQQLRNLHRDRQMRGR